MAFCSIVGGNEKSGVGRLIDGRLELDVVRGAYVDSRRSVSPNDSSTKLSGVLCLCESCVLSRSWVNIVQGGEMIGKKKDSTYASKLFGRSTSIGDSGNIK